MVQASVREGLLAGHILREHLLQLRCETVLEGWVLAEVVSHPTHCHASRTRTRHHQRRGLGSQFVEVHAVAGFGVRCFDEPRRTQCKLNHDIHRKQLEPEVNIKRLSLRCKLIHLPHKLLQRKVHIRLKELQRLRTEAVGNYTAFHGMLLLIPSTKETSARCGKGIIPTRLRKPVSSLPVPVDLLHSVRVVERDAVGTCSHGHGVRVLGEEVGDPLSSSALSEGVGFEDRADACYPRSWDFGLGGEEEAVE